MKKYIVLFKIQNVPYIFHYSSILIIVAAFLISIMSGAALFLLIAGVHILICIHEYGHQYAAQKYGLEVQSVTIWPLLGITLYEDSRQDWKADFIIASAGIGFQCILLVLAITFVQVFGYGVHPYLNTLIFIFYQLNLGMIFLNLLPVDPLDGHTVFHHLKHNSKRLFSVHRSSGKDTNVYKLKHYKR